MDRHGERRSDRGHGAAAGDVIFADRTPMVRTTRTDCPERDPRQSGERYLSVGPRAVQAALASLPWADSEAPEGEVG